MRVTMLDDERANLARNLAALRIASKLTQDEIADATGISVSTMRAWEEQRSTPNSRDALEPLAKLFGVTITSLFNPARVLARAMEQPPELQDIYPMNLMKAALYFHEDDETIPEDVPIQDLLSLNPEVFLHDIHTQLSEKQLKVVEYRFRDGMAFSDIGELLGMSRERCRQIQNAALSKLYFNIQSDRYKNYSHQEVQKLHKELTEARETINQLRKANRELLKQSEDFANPTHRSYGLLKPSDSINKLNLNVHSWNALHRAGVKTVQELVEHDFPTSIRGVGKACCADILNCLHEHNVDISHTVWDRLEENQ